MKELPRIIPDVEHLLLLEPEELGAKLLFAYRNRPIDQIENKGTFVPESLINELWASQANDAPQYPRSREQEIRHALVEAWAWLEAQGLIIPGTGGAVGHNPWRMLSRRARKFADEVEFTRFAVARRLPREVLHPRIAQGVWMSFMRGEFDVGVLQAMKAVEIAVREASGLSNLIGVDLMRRAFGPNGGPLTDMGADGGERTGRMELFAGAIGSFKNPLSHRDVNLDDPNEALELILLANHLLRIVDSRLKAKATVAGA